MISRNYPRGTEVFEMGGVSTQIRAGHLQNTCIECYRYANLLNIGYAIVGDRKSVTVSCGRLRSDDHALLLVIQIMCPTFPIVLVKN
jgi:hypothetical protein